MNATSQNLNSTTAQSLAEPQLGGYYNRFEGVARTVPGSDNGDCTIKALIK